MSTKQTLEWNEKESKFIFKGDFKYGSVETEKIIKEHYEKELEDKIKTKEQDFDKKMATKKDVSFQIETKFRDLFSKEELEKIKKKYVSVFGGLFSQNLSEIFLNNLEIKGTLIIDKTYQENFNDQKRFQSINYIINESKTDRHLREIKYILQAKNIQDNGINIKVTNSKIRKVIIKDIDIDSIKIEDTEIEKFIINNVDIKEKLSFKKNRTTLICMILNRINFEEDSKVLFENLKIENFVYRKSYQESKFFDMNDIEVLKQFRIFKVFLKNTQFNNLNIENTNTIKLSHISFKDTIFNNVQWGKDLSEKRFTASRDTFRQLKFVNDSQGNFIEANSFYSEEMRRYKQEIEQEPKKFSFQDKLIFLLNEKVSNFGQDWFLPIFWFFAITLIQYLINLGYENNTLFNIYEPCNNCFSNISNFLNDLAKNILPLKKFLNSGFEFLSLIFYGIYITLIYHLTIALRRQTKR